MKPDMAHDHPELGQISAQVRSPSNRFDGVVYVVRQGVGGDLDLDGAVAAGGADEFPVSGRGAIMTAGQKIQVGLSHAHKTAEVIVEADTRALRHIQRSRAFELVSA